MNSEQFSVHVKISYAMLLCILASWHWTIAQIIRLILTFIWTNFFSLASFQLQTSRRRMVRLDRIWGDSPGNDISYGKWKYQWAKCVHWLELWLRLRSWITFLLLPQNSPPLLCLYIIQPSMCHFAHTFQRDNTSNFCLFWLNDFKTITEHLSRDMLFISPR